MKGDKVMVSRGPNANLENDSPWFVCTSCNLMKLREEFYFKINGRPDGCKQCNKERAARWRKENPERVKEYTAYWTKENPEYAARWIRENPENNAGWRKENHERHKENAVRWKSENLERAKENYVRWIKENPEKKKESDARWRKENPERMRGYRARRNGYSTDHPGIHPLLDSIIIKTMACYFPGCKNTDITMDHIKPLSKDNGLHEDQNVASLCRSHNSSKGKRTFEEWSKITGVPALELEQAAYDANERALDLLEFLTMES
jgi:hypothetical protein